jgi:3-phenylpropionate/trans-cinnamate dioxygenase ferredoxin reductase component
MAYENVVIVGAGHAGGCAAAALRAASFGGRITLVGNEKHPPYERPPLSKELLAGSIAVEKTYLRPLDWYATSNIELRLDTNVIGIDRAAGRLHLSDAASIPYDALLLTTGARARTVTFAEPSNPRIFYLRDIDDSLALRQRLTPGIRLAIIGAGFIGLEIAATARKAGCDVTVLELAPQPLARVAPPEIGAHVAELHRRNGVELRFGCSVEAIDAAEATCTIHTGDAKIVADLIAIGIGAVPNTELAKGAGLTVDDGVVVDQFGRISDPYIFAAGDVTRHFNPLLGRAIRLEAWQNAQNQATAVGSIIAGGEKPFAEVPWLWTDQYDMNMQVAGAAQQWDHLVYRGDPAGKSFMAFQLLNKKVVGAFSVNAAREMRFARILIASGKAIDADLLADEKTKLQEVSR